MRSPRLGCAVGGLVALVLSASFGGAGAADGEHGARASQGVSATEARALVEQLTVDVERLRQLSFERPVPVRVIDDATAREHLVARIHKFQPPDELARLQRAYELLGLLPADFSLLDAFLEVLRVQAGGFYDPDDETFFVLDDVPRAVAPVVIVHELTHALEDQHFDLDRRLRDVLGDDDRLLARSAIHEGSATLLMSAHLSRKLLAGEFDAEALQSYAAGEAERLQVLELLPPVFQRQLLAPYLVGSTFLQRGDPLRLLTEGYPAADVDRAYADPPRSSEQILHPGKYWEERDDPTAVALPQVGRRLGRGWRRTASGVLGEMTLGVLVGATTPLTAGDPASQRGDRWTNAAASGWDGDRWELWQRGDAAVVLLATVWDSASDAREFADALPRDRGLHWRVDGARVAVVAGLSGRRTERVLQRLLAVESSSAD